MILIFLLFMINFHFSQEQDILSLKLGANNFLDSISRKVNEAIEKKTVQEEKKKQTNTPNIKVVNKQQKRNIILRIVEQLKTSKRKLQYRFTPRKKLLAIIGLITALIILKFYQNFQRSKENKSLLNNYILSLS